MLTGQLVFAQLMDYFHESCMLACRTLLQMDQTKPPHQTLLRQLRNAVKTQVWVAISVYVLIAIARKQLNSQRPMSELLQIHNLTLFEKNPLNQAFSHLVSTNQNPDERNLLPLFD